MKKRLISYIIGLLILIPLLIIGGVLYKVAAIALGIIGVYELIKAKSKSKEVPLLIKIITIFNFVFIMLINFGNEFVLNIDYKYLILTPLMLFIPLIFYHDEKKYSIEDATFFSGFSIFLTLAFSVLMMIREYNVYYLVFLLLVTIASDTFAYIIGSLIGKHKMSPTISPNKSIEGFVGGLVFGTFITASIYYVTFDYSGNVFVLILFIMLLSIMSTLGDLLFSFIKRHFDIKDFGNIMPGHGGVLDRLDSLLFVLLTFCLIVGIL